MARLTAALTLLAASAVGLVAAHFLDYLLLFPRGSQRHALLIHSGHGYLPAAAWLAGGAAAVAAIGAATFGFRRGQRGPGGGMGWGRTSLLLAAIQTTGFVTLEPLERLLVGAPVDDVVGPLLAVGVLLQVLLAMGAAAILQLIARKAEALGRRLCAPPPAARRRVIRFGLCRDARAVRLLLPHSFSVRGPPTRLPRQLSI